MTPHRRRCPADAKLCCCPDHFPGCTPPVAPDSLVARLRGVCMEKLCTKCSNQRREAADHIERQAARIAELEKR